MNTHRNTWSHAVGDRPLRLLRLPEVIQRTGRSRTGIYREVQEGTFPKPVRASLRSVAWIEGEVDQWIAARIAASRGPVGGA